MISERLLSIVRCPDCGGRLANRPPACERCGRAYGGGDASYLDLRPGTAFAETTKYLDDALHADARHESVSPPLLSAGVRNGMLQTFLQPASGDTIVDLGCGSGRALVWNASSGAYLVGVDVSAHFAAQARDQVDLVVGDLRRLPFADAAFSKAFSLDVAEHLSRESLVQVLSEARRVLQPGGRLFLYTHVRRNSKLALGLRAINHAARALDRAGVIALQQERLRKSDHLNPLADMADFRAVAVQSGFRLERVRYYTPLIGGFVENILVRVAEGMMARRAAKRAGRPSAADIEGLRTARLDAKRRIDRGGWTYSALVALTRVMTLDVRLFGRIESGPFFALLVKERE